MREPQRLQHCKNADNLMSNHIYRDGQSITTAGNQNRSIKCRYFSDIRLGKQLQSVGGRWRIFGKEMSVRTSLATRRGAQIFGHRFCKRLYLPSTYLLHTYIVYSKAGRISKHDIEPNALYKFHVCRCFGHTIILRRPLLNNRVLSTSHSLCGTSVHLSGMRAQKVGYSYRPDDNNL